MIDGIGVDTIETARVKKQLAVDHGFKEAIFTADEIAYCDSKRNSAPYYAARFAAKEAFLKALGTGWAGGIRWQDVEILRKPGAAPTIQVHGLAATIAVEKGVRAVQVSLSHSDEAAVATVLLES